MKGEDLRWGKGRMIRSGEGVGGREVTSRYCICMEGESEIMHNYTNHITIYITNSFSTKNGIPPSPYLA